MLHVCVALTVSTTLTSQLNPWIVIYQYLCGWVYVHVCIEYSVPHYPSPFLCAVHMSAFRPSTNSIIQMKMHYWGLRGSLIQKLVYQLNTYVPIYLS